MLELLVAPDMGNLIPAVLFQASYDFSAGHNTLYTLCTHLSNSSQEGAQWEPSGPNPSQNSRGERAGGEPFHTSETAAKSFRLTSYPDALLFR